MVSHKEMWHQKQTHQALTKIVLRQPLALFTVYSNNSGHLLWCSTVSFHVPLFLWEIVHQSQAQIPAWTYTCVRKYFLKLGFTSCKTEQPLQDIELQGKETQKD